MQTSDIKVLLGLMLCIRLLKELVDALVVYACVKMAYLNSMVYL